jgi:outer membrane immunogenic protein
MKKSLLGLVAISALIGGPAMAADMPLKAPPAPVAPPAYSWTGFYLGINGGWGEARENWLDNNGSIPPGCGVGVGFASATCPVSFRPDGGIFGGQIGYRYQLNSNFVIGVEGTAAWADLDQTISLPNANFPTLAEEFKVRSLYTATGQVGWAGWNQALLYVKGGWAGANTNWLVGSPTAVAPNTPFTGAHSENNNGWTVGVGLDYAIWNNFVAGIEYDHYDLGYSAFTTAVSNGGTPAFIASPSRLTIDAVVGRLSYKFNWAAAPIATRY